MEENGYVEYSRWFDTIEEELNEENYVGKTDEFEHFVFNGLHIYKNGNNTVIMNEEKDKPDTRYFRRMERYYDKLLKLHKIIISGGSGMPAIIYGDNHEDYVYLPADITKEPTRFETESYETRGLESYETRGIASSDVVRIMSYAKSKAVNEDTKKVYDEVIGLYDDIESAYSVAITYQNRRNTEQNLDDDKAEGLTEPEKAQLDEANFDRKDDDKMFSRAEDFTPDELEQMSAEELGDILVATEAKNTTKREELNAAKKEYLISRIREAVAEGKKLDAEIETVRNTTKEK